MHFAREEENANHLRLLTTDFVLADKIQQKVSGFFLLSIRSFSLQFDLSTNSFYERKKQQKKFRRNRFSFGTVVSSSAGLDR